VLERIFRGNTRTLLGEYCTLISVFVFACVWLLIRLKELDSDCRVSYWSTMMFEGCIMYMIYALIVLIYRYIKGWVY
jgi:Na+-driven multidrug efflux pump